MITPGKNGQMQETIDFGKVIEGEKVHLEFKIKNSGTGNLIISKASAICRPFWSPLYFANIFIPSIDLECGDGLISSL